MAYDPRKHHRRSIRLPSYDYAQAGQYFVTIVTHGRQLLFGEVLDETMHLSKTGRVVEALWRGLAGHFAGVSGDVVVVMPNHLHGVVVISDVPPMEEAESSQGARQEGAEAAASEAPLVRPTLGQIVAYLKYEAAKGVNAVRGTPGERVWQRNYYEHVIRDEDEYKRACRYIVENPLRWAVDRENPAATPPRRR